MDIAVVMLYVKAESHIVEISAKRLRCLCKALFTINLKIGSIVLYCKVNVGFVLSYVIFEV